VNALLAKLTQKINAMNLRERSLVLAAVLGSIALLWNTLLIDPKLQDNHRLRGEISALQQQLGQLDQQIRLVEARRTQDPDRTNRLRLAKLKDRQKAAESEIKKATTDFIAPRRMAVVLEDILKQHKKIRLLSMENLPTEELLPPGSEETPEEQNLHIYKHGFSMKLKGNFLDIMEYLKSLELMNWRFHWDDLEHRADKFPDAFTTIRVHTLSLDRSWIGV